MMAEERTESLATRAANLALPPFPPKYIDRVAFDRGAFTLYVPPELRSDPLIVTWLHQVNATSGQTRMPVARRDVDEIAKMRERGLVFESSVSKEDALRMREAALALIANACSVGASDIHLLLRGSHAEVQVRVKGDLKVMTRMSQTEAESISRALFQSIATIKDGAYVPLEFQNGQISGEEVRKLGLTSVRLVRGPAYPVEDGGGFVIMRLQYDSFHTATNTPKTRVDLSEPRRPEGQIDLDSMGFDEWQIEQLNYLANCPNGLIILTGPTGSGKTTTLYEINKHIGREMPEKRLVTIEDPVEYPMSWALQMVIANAIGEAATGEAFSEALRTSLRMDPDVLLVGELRGAESAVTAFDAALTGHLVFATMHTTDPFKPIDRLELLDPVRLTRKFVCDHTTLRGVVAQRLVPLLCEECSEPMDRSAIPKSILAALETYGDLSRVRVKGKGCPSCHGDGVTKRVAVAEIVVCDRQLMADYIDHGVDVARNRHRERKDTDMSLLERAVKMALDGKVDPRDVSSKVEAIRPKGCGD